MAAYINKITNVIKFGLQPKNNFANWALIPQELEDKICVWDEVTLTVKENIEKEELNRKQGLRKVFKSNIRANGSQLQDLRVSLGLEQITEESYEESRTDLRDQRNEIKVRYNLAIGGE